MDDGPESFARDASDARLGRGLAAGTRRADELLRASIDNESMEREPLLGGGGQQPKTRDELNAQKPAAVSSFRPDGISQLNLVIYVLSTLFTVSFLVFLNSSQAFVLTTIIGVPNNQLGSISGTLGFADQLVSLPATYIWGALSDRVLPRRVVYGIGFFVVSLALFIYPNVPTAYPGLIIVRCLFALGASACTAMMTACLADHALPSARGRLAGIVGTSTGCGALLALFVFLRVPAWTGSGEDSAGGIRAAYYVVATAAATWASLTLVGLQPGLTLRDFFINPPENDQRKGDEIVHSSASPSSLLDREVETGEPAEDESDPLLRGVSGKVVRRSHDVLDSSADVHADLEDSASSNGKPEDGAGGETNEKLGLPFWKSLWHGVLAMRNPRVLLGYLGAICVGCWTGLGLCPKNCKTDLFQSFFPFQARGDTIALTLFLPLFFARYYFSSGRCPKPKWEPHDPAELKRACREAYLKASSAAGAAQLAALLASLFWGLLADKLDRIVVLLVSAAIGVAGYGGMVSTTNPLEPWTYLWTTLLGLAESGLIVSSLALVSKVPEQERGGVAGAYSFFGAAGVLASTKIGGYLFDSFGPGWAWAVGLVACGLCLVVGTVVVAVLGGTRKADMGEVATADAASDAGDAGDGTGDQA